MPRRSGFGSVNFSRQGAATVEQLSSFFVSSSSDRLIEIIHLSYHPHNLDFANTLGNITPLCSLVIHDNPDLADDLEGHWNPITNVFTTPNAQATISFVQTFAQYNSYYLPMNYVIPAGQKILVTLSSIWAINNGTGAPFETDGTRTLDIVGRDLGSDLLKGKWR